MEKVKVSLVSYLNSRPFAYGLNHSEIYEYISLSLDPPSLCAEKLIKGRTDVGLVPVAVIPEIPNGVIISDYCISATGKVRSVLMLSDVPVSNIENIILDHESRTSVMLAQLLAREYWMIEPRWQKEQNEGFTMAKGTTAAVVIGDRALKMHSRFNFVYDLSEEWQKMTGLPFVFACWAANKVLDDTFLLMFNNALKFGVEHINELGLKEGLTDSEKKYLTSSIQYQLNDKKREGMNLFLKMIKGIN